MEDSYRQVRARTLVQTYINEVKPISTEPLEIDDIYVVWFCKTLENWKALLGTNYYDNMYYEVTHNGYAHETYIDVYQKMDNVCVIGESVFR